MHKRITLIASAIFYFVWLTCGNEVWYEWSKSVNKSSCSSNQVVSLQRQIADGMTATGNGIYIGKNVILTNKHVASNDLQVWDATGQRVNVVVNKFAAHPNLDVAILFLNNNLNLEIADWADTDGLSRQLPYYVLTARDNLSAKYAGNNLLIQEQDQFGILHSPETMILFRNQATQPGDSGGALLNEDCKLVGIVVGGNRSFYFGLQAKSFYINLTNPEVRSWVERKIRLVNEEDPLW